MEKPNTHAEYVKLVHKKHGDRVRVAGRYAGMRVCIEHVCKVHGSWNTRPESILRGVSCGACGHDRQRFTHAEYVNIVHKKHGDRVRVVGQYVDMRTRIEHVCSEHGLWLVSPSSIVRGSRCRRCGSDRLRHTHAEYVKRVRERHGARVTVVGTYTGMHDSLEFSCKKHGSWVTKPYCVVNGTGCQRCYWKRHGKTSRKTHERYVSELAARNITPLSRYTKARNPIRHRCSQGHVWRANPCDVLSCGCPLCDNSQYRRRPVRVGRRTVMVQGSEGAAVGLLLAEGIQPDDLIFTKAEGKPTFQYQHEKRDRRYNPDIYQCSTRLVIEVKSTNTFGIYDSSLFALVCAKARAVLKAGYPYRLMIINRGRNVDLGSDWYTLTHTKVCALLKVKMHEQDLRYQKKLGKS